jgi:CBS domain-containing protein
MKKLYCKSGTGIGLAMLATSTFAAQLGQLQSAINTMMIYVALLLIIVGAFYAYFMRVRDKRSAPVERLFEGRDTIHAVGPDASVAECVRKMITEKFDALIVMDGERLVGIFTERDALNKVLGAGLDPVSTKISEVMTKDPLSVPPRTTIGEATEVVTKWRLRHLPIVDDGKLLAVISSGDLTYWLAQDKAGEVQELVDLAAHS